MHKLISYKSPHICGVDQMQLVDPTEIYVTANFTSCGRQNFAVTFENEIYLHKTVADFRREDIVLPKLDGKEVGRAERNPNVFKNFIVDTHTTYENCSKYDFEGWKLAKFVKELPD